MTLAQTVHFTRYMRSVSDLDVHWAVMCQWVLQSHCTAHGADWTYLVFTVRQKQYDQWHTWTCLLLAKKGHWL